MMILGGVLAMGVKEGPIAAMEVVGWMGLAVWLLLPLANWSYRRGLFDVRAGGVLRRTRQSTGDPFSVEIKLPGLRPRDSLP